MNVVFMGTPDFADNCLKALMASHHKVKAVFTRADSRQSRGMKLKMPPVKQTALDNGIPVFQPATLKDPDIKKALYDLNPDIIVVAAYGMLHPSDILNLPRYGCINVHASLLPKYRGASPINAAIINGESQSGVTIMKMARKLDTGDILISQPVNIAPDASFGSLHDKLAKEGAGLLLRALDLIESGSAQYIKQDDSLSSYAHMIKNEDALVSFLSDARKVSCHIRGYDPVPGAFGFLGSEKIKLFGAVYFDGSAEREPGKVIRCGKDGLLVQAENGTVLIREVQLSGKKRMSADDCFRGRPKLLDEVFK